MRNGRQTDKYRSIIALRHFGSVFQSEHFFIPIAFNYSHSLSAYSWTLLSVATPLVNNGLYVFIYFLLTFFLRLSLYFKTY